MLRVFIGYDPREAVAFSVLSYSIHARSSVPVSIAALKLSELGGILTRERDPLQSTDFSFSRFLVPYLSGYEGWSLYLDCDMLMLEDVAELFGYANAGFAVLVVPHDHRPKEKKKFLGEKQTAYARKNWSSVMLFNNARCRRLTPDYVNRASGLELHQFRWLGAERESDEIGTLPSRWNHLVGYDKPRPDAAIAHYTLGGPYFRSYETCEYGREWHRECTAMLSGVLL